MAIFKLCADCKELLKREALKDGVTIASWFKLALGNARECLWIQTQMQAAFNGERIGFYGPRSLARDRIRPDLCLLRNLEMSYLAGRLEVTTTLESRIFSESQRR